MLGLSNPGKKTVPDLAITIWTGETKADGSFNTRLDNPALANPSRPGLDPREQVPEAPRQRRHLANVEKAPSAGAETAHTDTYSFGPLKPGKSKVIDWRVTPATTGTYTVHYVVRRGSGQGEGGDASEAGRSRASSW